VPEFVFDPKIGRFAKDDDAGDFHNGSAGPENGKNKDPPEMISKKLLEKYSNGKHKNGKD
jgi:hypothetical protein